MSIFLKYLFRVTFSLVLSMAALLLINQVYFVWYKGDESNWKETAVLVSWMTFFALPEIGIMLMVYLLAELGRKVPDASSTIKLISGKSVVFGFALFWTIIAGMFYGFVLGVFLLPFLFTVMMFGMEWAFLSLCNIFLKLTNH